MSTNLTVLEDHVKRSDALIVGMLAVQLFVSGMLLYRVSAISDRHFSIPARSPEERERLIKAGWRPVSVFRGRGEILVPPPTKPIHR